MTATAERIDVEFTFPGTWHRVDAAAGDPLAALTASLLQASTTATATPPEFGGLSLSKPEPLPPQVREVLGTILQSTSADAAKAGATAMYVATEVAAGVAATASLGVFPFPQPLTPAIGTSPHAVMQAFEAGYERLRGDEPCAERGIVTVAGKELYRVVKVTPVELPATVHDAGITDPEQLAALRELGMGDDGAIPSFSRLRVDVWMPVPGTKRVVLAAFSSDFGLFADPLTQLFTAIAASARFTTAQPAG